jgi:DNA-binding winged helix-turn-helix (wHTH) protein
LRFRFENHELDGELRELTRDGVRIPMQPQVFDLLLFLVEIATASSARTT